MKKKKAGRQELVSIIMPARNTAAFLVDAIESIKAQTYTKWELFIVDDASTDGTPLILQAYKRRDKRIKVITNKKKKGIGASLNVALAKAKGTYIARMDADDISLPERLEEQVNILAKRKDLVAVGGQAAMIDPKGNVFAYKRFPTDPKVLKDMIMQIVPIQHPIMMAKASVYKKYKYLESVKTAEDVDMLFYMLSKGKISNAPSLVYKYRKTDMSNGYHNVKETFRITYKTRKDAIKKYGYQPSLRGTLISEGQAVVVKYMPAKMILKIFEMLRYDPPLWKWPINFALKGGLPQFFPQVAK